MPLLLIQVLQIVAIVLTLASGGWLLIHARAVARLFGRARTVEPGPSEGAAHRSPPRRVTIAMLLAFNIGWIVSVAIWSWAMTEDASAVVEARSQ